MASSFKSIQRWGTVFFSTALLPVVTSTLCNGLEEKCTSTFFAMYLLWLHLLFPLPETCFPQVVTRLAHSLPSGFCSRGISSQRLSLTNFSETEITLHISYPAFLSFIAININIFIAIDIKINVYVLKNTLDSLQYLRITAKLTGKYREFS